MATVQAKNMILSVRLDNATNTADASALLCATNCTISVQSNVLPTKHKSSGAAQSFIYKDYGWSISAQAVYKIDTASTTLFSGDAILTGLIKQRKYVVQFSSTDGTDTITYYGRVLITNLQLGSSYGDMGRVNVELQGDGELYYSPKASYLPDTFPSAIYVQYVATGTVSIVTDTNLINNNLIMIAKNKKILGIEVDAFGNTPSVGNVTLVPLSGNLVFNPDLVSGDVVEYYYD